MKPLARSWASAVEWSLRAVDKRLERPVGLSESAEGFRDGEVGWREASLSCLWAVAAGSCSVEELLTPVPGCLTMPKLLDGGQSCATLPSPSLPLFSLRVNKQ